VKLIARVGRIEDGCPDLETGSVDFSLFSPPYFKRDGYTPALMRGVGKVLARVMKPGARAYMVFGQILEDLDRPLEAQRLILEGANGELAAGQTIIWVKSIAVGGWTESAHCPACSVEVDTHIPVLSRGHFQPISSPNLLNYCWEYVFSFVRTPVECAAKLNRIGIGVEFADKSNLKRGTRGKNGDVHCPGDAWFVPHQTTGNTTKKTHRHEFPEELARRLIVLANPPASGMVCDLFLGGGTTALTAKKLGFNACGYDCNPDAVTALQKRWTGA